MTRAIATHPVRTINCTERAQCICQQLNEYMRWVPDAKFKDACDWFNRIDWDVWNRRTYPLSYTTLRRYYTGSYHLNDFTRSTFSKTLVRVGVKVEL